MVSKLNKFNIALYALLGDLCSLVKLVVSISVEDRVCMTVTITNREDINKLFIFECMCDYFITGLLIAVDRYGVVSKYIYTEDEEWVEATLELPERHDDNTPVLVVDGAHLVNSLCTDSSIRTFKEYTEAMLRSTTYEVQSFEFKHSILKCFYTFEFYEHTYGDIQWDSIAGTITNETNWLLLDGSTMDVETSDRILTLTMRDGVWRRE